jgi:hypothetical protein
MPKRPQQHVIGDEASLAVQRLVVKAGFAVETIRNDYGEDLLVQTSHAGEIDASRLWLQVKGTRAIHKYSRTDSQFAYTVPLQNAIKWVRSSDLVVVVLWDLANEIGYFSKPAEQVDEWDQRVNSKKTTTLLFNPKDTFTAQAASRLAWESRLHRYYGLILAVNASLAEFDDDNTKQLRTVLVMDFLALIGVISQPTERDEWGLTPAARNHLINAFMNTEDEDVDKRLLKSGLLTVLYHTHEVSGGAGLSSILLEPSASMLVAMI